jgi:hypothetical protein
MSSRGRAERFAGGARGAPREVAAAVTLASLALLAPSPAHAQSWSDRGDKSAQSAEMNKRTTRDGLVVGFGLGVGFGGASGYPNSASKIDQPAYYTSSDLLLGRTTNLFVMGALADYLNFGLWYGSGHFASQAWSATSGGGGFRLEVFPLFTLVPSLKDLGVLASLGLGSSKLVSKDGSSAGADGVQSFLGTGVFYEWSLFHALGGHVALGPSLDYDAVVTRSITSGALSGGFRLAFYGGL